MFDEIVTPLYYPNGTKEATLNNQERRHLACPGCNTTLRLKISAGDYGKKIEVTCPTCGAKVQTTITDSEKTEALLKNLLSIALKALEESPEYGAAEKALCRAGMGFRLILVTEVWPIISRKEESAPLEPKMEKYTKDDFSTQDREYLAKEFKISLDD